MNDFLFDTCAVIWTAHGDALHEPAATQLQGAFRDGGRLFVSPITAWEIAMLAAKGGIALTLDPHPWFERFCELPSVALAAMPTSVLVASTCLPGTPPHDPADRIIIATARAFGYVLATRDAKILDYGAQGHVQVVGC